MAGPVTNSDVAVTNGLFTTTLNFGPGIFSGANYWLQIAVRTNGNGAFHHAVTAPAAVAGAVCDFCEHGEQSARQRRRDPIERRAALRPNQRHLFLGS